MAIPQSSQQNDAERQADLHPLGGEAGKPKKSGWMWILAAHRAGRRRVLLLQIAPFLREQGRARARRQGSRTRSRLGGRHAGSEAKRSLLSFGPWDGDRV